MKTNEVEREDEPQPDEPVHTQAPTVDLSTVDDEPEDDDDAPGVPGSGRRPQKTRNYIKELKGKLSGFEAQLAERDRRDQESARELAELRGRLQAQDAAAARQTQRQDNVDPVGAEVKNIRGQQRTIMRAIQAAQDPAEAEKLQDQWQELDDKRVELLVSRKAGRGEDDGEAAREQERRHGQMTLETEFPQVMGDDVLRLEAQAATLRITRAGRLRGIAAAKAGCEEVMRRHQLGPKPRPTDNDRARHAGVSSRAGANGGGQNWTATPGQMSLARAYCNNDARRELDDNEKWRIWVKEIGKPQGLAG